MQDHANEPRTPAIDFMNGRTEPKKSSKAKGGKMKNAARAVNTANRVTGTAGKKSTGKLSTGKPSTGKLSRSRFSRRSSREAPAADCELARERRRSPSTLLPP